MGMEQTKLHQVLASKLRDKKWPSIFSAFKFPHINLTVVYTGWFNYIMHHLLLEYISTKA